MTWEDMIKKEDFKFVEGEFEDNTEITDAVVDFKKEARGEISKLNIDASALSRVKGLFYKFLDEARD
tara:strand:+ start:3040 stop:3240 length:201 start_codon:yes stop_codon:yes gene_type:complete